MPPQRRFLETFWWIFLEDDVLECPGELFGRGRYVIRPHRRSPNAVFRKHTLAPKGSILESLWEAFGKLWASFWHLWELLDAIWPSFGPSIFAHPKKLQKTSCGRRETPPWGPLKDLNTQLGTVKALETLHWCLEARWRISRGLQLPYGKNKNDFPVDIPYFKDLRLCFVGP